MLNLPHPRRVLAGLALALAFLAGFSVSAFGSSSQSPRIGEYFFHPGKVTINTGTKVTWKWVGSLNHNVTVKSGPSKFHSRNQARGTFSWTFRRRGTWHLYCTLHPGMKETIYVH